MSTQLTKWNRCDSRTKKTESFQEAKKKWKRPTTNSKENTIAREKSRWRQKLIKWSETDWKKTAQRARRKRRTSFTRMLTHFPFFFFFLFVEVFVWRYIERTLSQCHHFSLCNTFIGSFFKRISLFSSCASVWIDKYTQFPSSFVFPLLFASFAFILTNKTQWLLRSDVYLFRAGMAFDLFKCFVSFVLFLFSFVHSIEAKAKENKFPLNPWKSRKKQQYFRPSRVKWALQTHFFRLTDRLETKRDHLF